MWRGVLVVLSVCAVVLAIVLIPTADAEDKAAPVERAYQVGVGDIVRVEAFQHDEVSGEFPVEEGGAITYPLLDSVQVSGLTVSEVSHLLEELLEKDFYVDVQLQVEVKEYRSQPVTVLGEVGRPGTYYLEGHTTLLQILAEAGGLRDSAGPVVELRRVAGAVNSGEQKVLTFSTSKLFTGEEGGEVEVRVGDVISVSAKQLYFITGEVARPGQYEIARGMTLWQAVTQAGGLGKFASQSGELHREVEGEKQILDFDLARIRKGKQTDPLIRSGDVIIIKRRFF